MSEQLSSHLRNFLGEYYIPPSYEKIPVPRNTIKRKKTIEEEVTETKTRTKTVPNPILGNTLLIVGSSLVLLLLIVTFSTGISIGVPMIVALAIIIAGGIARNKMTKKVYETFKETRMVPKEIEEEVLEDQRYEEVRIKDRFTIRSLKKVNLHFSVADFNKSTLLIFEEGNSKNIAQFPVIDNPEKFESEYKAMAASLDQVPDLLHGDTIEVESSESSQYGDTVPLRGFEKSLVEFLDSVVLLLSKRKYVDLQLSLLKNNKILKYLDPTKTLNSHPQATELENLLQGKQGVSFEELLKTWPVEIAQKIDQLNDIRVFSLDKTLSSEFLSFGQTAHFSSFNFYCPDCNSEIADELIARDYSVQNDSNIDRIVLSKNTRCFYNPENQTWKCPVCNNLIQKPIPIHKALDEVLLPSYDKLMEEHKVERDKRYSQTRSMELEYRKEFKTRVDQIKYENLSQIMALEDEMERMKAEISGQKEAITYINEVAKNHQNVTSHLLGQIELDTKHTEERVAQRQQKVSQMLSDYTKNKLSAYGEKMHELSKAKRIDDERREAIMRETVMAVKENTDVTRQVGEKVYEAVKENTDVTRESGEKITSAVNENTNVTREGHQKLAELGEQQRDQQKKHYALNAAVAKQQGYDVDNYGRFKFGKKLNKFTKSIESNLSGHSAVEKEVHLNN